MSRLLSAGTAVTLQASNDITVGRAVTSTGSGALALHAGRSVLVNAGVDTSGGNGNITLIANDLARNGVVRAEREAGAAVIAFGEDASLNAGSGVVTLELRAGTGRTGTFAQSGDITLRNLTAGRISAVNSGATAQSDIVIASGSTLSASGTGDALVLAGDRFINHAGASALNASHTNGRYLVWSGNPADDTRGDVTYQFKQYGATYGTTPVAQSTGDGLLYTHAPSFETSLSGGAVTKVYDSTTDVDVSSLTFTTTPLIDGDQVRRVTSTGTFASKHVGTHTVTLSNLNHTFRNGDATVYGYTSTTRSLSTNGTITPKGLTVSGITAADKVYDGTTTATVNTSSAVLTGLISGDALTVSATTGLLRQKRWAEQRGDLEQYPRWSRCAELHHHPPIHHHSGYHPQRTEPSRALPLPIKCTTATQPLQCTQCHLERITEFARRGRVEMRYTTSQVYRHLLPTSMPGTTRCVTLNSTTSGADVPNYTITAPVQRYRRHHPQRADRFGHYRRRQRVRRHHNRYSEAHQTHRPERGLSVRRCAHRLRHHRNLLRQARWGEQR